jgi:hypothetical protein
MAGRCFGAVSKILRPISWNAPAVWRASVLECGSPLPLSRRQSCRWKSGRGLPHSKTSRSYSDAPAKAGRSFIETGSRPESGCAIGGDGASPLLLNLLK